MKRRQRGFTFILVVLALATLTVLGLVELLRGYAGPGAGSLELQQRFGRAHDALASYVAQESRLPCPANPNLDNGTAVPETPVNNCTYPTGSLPWRTLGLRREDAYDEWDWKVSYRVFAGAQGLTRDEGATLVKCRRTPSGPGGTVAGRCRAHPLFPANLSQNDTTRDQYLAGKGLALTDHGNARTDVAYVLISHGSSGRGAHPALGGPSAAPVSADELDNLSPNNFVAKAASAAGVGPDDAAHFDDIVSYRTLAALLARAGLVERDWP